MAFSEIDITNPENDSNILLSLLSRKLDESEDNFINFIEQAPVAVAVVDLQGKIEYINLKAEKLFGYQISDISTVDNWWHHAYPDEDYRREVMILWNNDLLKAINDPNEKKSREYNVTCKDGNVKVVIISMVIIRKRILILFEDLTDKKKIEKALQESEQHYKLITELTTDYVFKLGIGKDGNVTMDFISDNYYTITGRKKEQSNIQFWDQIIHPDDLPGLMANLKSMMTKPLSTEYVCRSFIHGNHQRWIHVVSRSEWDEKQQRITSITGAVKDITEQKKAENEIIEKNAAIEARNAEYARLNEQLIKTNRELTIAKEKAEESDQLKTAFLQNMSHEIRTPMNAIMGFASILKDNFDNKPKLEKFCEIINSRCNDLLEIINDLLDISKIESGQAMLNIEECNLVELFSELNMFFKEHQIRMNKSHIDFNMVMNCGSDQTLIFADPVKLKQIFINLISNAFKFTEKGHIFGGCKVNDNKELVFYVSDTGIGIPKDKHSVIFERFTQLGDNRVKSYGGTGLGLAIVKGLIQLMDGKIWLESEQEEPGKKKPGRTTFYFTIPYKKAAVKTINHKAAENN